MKKNPILFTVIFLLSISGLDAQHFQRSIGGLYDDGAYKMIPGIDGGFVLAGYTLSYGNSPGNNADGYVVKTDVDGNIEWTRTYGTIDADQIYWIDACKDSTYLFCGQTVDMITGYSLLNVAKISLTGDLIWQKNYKVGNYESGSCVSVTSDGGFLLGGQCDISSDEQLMLLKADSLGNVIWKKYFGGPDIENVDEILTLDDGGYLVAGTSRYGFYSNTLFFIRTDSVGNQLWAKTYNTSPALRKTYPGKMFELNTGGFIMTGTTTASGQPLSDILLMRLDDTGNIIWQKIYVTNEQDRAEDMVIDEDGNYLICGSTAIGSVAGYYDAAILKIDSSGNFISAFRIGTPTEDETAVNILLNTQQEIIVSGSIYGQGAGETDIFLFRSDKNYDTLICNSAGLVFIEDSVDLVASVYNGNWVPVVFETNGTLAENNGGLSIEICNLNSVVESVSGFSLVYPNPAEETIRFDLNRSLNEFVNFKVVNMLGEIVKSGMIKVSQFENSINIEELRTGSYFLVLEFRSGIERARFVKS